MTQIKGIVHKQGRNAVWILGNSVVMLIIVRIGCLSK